MSQHSYSLKPWVFAPNQARFRISSYMNDYPLFRDVMAMPSETDGRRMIAIHDPENLSGQSFMVSVPAFYLITMMDGKKSLEQIGDEFFRNSGQRVSMEDLRSLVQSLDDALLLDNERFREHKLISTKEFLDQPVRPPALAGRSYPEDTEELANMLDSAMEGEPVTDASLLRAIVAPHIDFRVGGDMMGMGWREAARSGAGIFVILGVGHSLTEDFVSVLDKDFATPLGNMRVNSGFIAKLAENFGESVSAQPEAHRNEHSVEFQSLFIARLFADRPEVTAVPILLSFPETVWEMDHPKFNGERIDRFAEALRKTADECGKKVVCVASVDFAHVGARFGDAGIIRDEDLSRIEQDDMELIETIKKGSVEEFLNKIRSVNGSNRVCGFPAIYTMMKAIGPVKGRLFGYRQNIEGDRENVVTFATMALGG